jgi:hypothetical protein
MQPLELNDQQYNHAPQQQQQPLPMQSMQDTPTQQTVEPPIYGQGTDLPHYELMIVHALQAISDPNGSPPKVIWDWMNRYISLTDNTEGSNYPCNPKFRASASQALQKALKKGRLIKSGSLYKINPDFNPVNAVYLNQV